MFLEESVFLDAAWNLPSYEGNSLPPKTDTSVALLPSAQRAPATCAADPRQGGAKSERLLRRLDSSAFALTEPRLCAKVSHGMAGTPWRVDGRGGDGVGIDVSKRVGG